MLLRVESVSLLLLSFEGNTFLRFSACRNNQSSFHYDSPNSGQQCALCIPTTSRRHRLVTSTRLCSGPKSHHVNLALKLLSPETAVSHMRVTRRTALHRIRNDAHHGRLRTVADVTVTVIDAVGANGMQLAYCTLAAVTSVPR